MRLREHPISVYLGGTRNKKCAGAIFTLLLPGFQEEMRIGVSGMGGSTPEITPDFGCGSKPGTFRDEKMTPLAIARFLNTRLFKKCKVKISGFEKKDRFRGSFSDFLSVGADLGG